MDIFYVFSGAIAGYFLIALYNTLLKEKTMVEEGGDPLPTSAYVFLTIKHVIWIGVTLLSGYVVPSYWFGSGVLLTFVISVGFVILSYVVATLIEVIIRTVIVYFKVRELKKAQKNTEDEGA